MNPQNRYLETQVSSASPGEQLIMLYDALIQHADQAATSISKPHGSAEYIQATGSLTRCIDILTELNLSLRHEVHPKLCQTLNKLYLFFMKEFSDARGSSNPEKIQKIIPLMQKLGNSWKQAHQTASQTQPEAQAA